MDKRWLRKEIPSQDLVEKLSKAININFCLSAILLQRGVDEFDIAKNFFRPMLEHLHDPFLMKDMDKAIDRITTALEKRENILIYGDYDVDGTTAVSLVYSYFKTFYSNCELYIPDRNAEGYGVSLTGIEWAEQNNYSLIISINSCYSLIIIVIKMVGFCLLKRTRR